MASGKAVDAVYHVEIPSAAKKLRELFYCAHMVHSHIAHFYALAGPDFSTDILGTFLYRTFFGFQLQLGDPYMGSAIAGAMFGIILLGVCVYLFGIQTRLRRYQF